MRSPSSPRPRARAPRALASSLLLLSACGSSSSTPKTVSMTVSAAEAAEAEAFSRLTNSIPTYVTVGGASGWAIVDTGNPWVLLDPSTFPSTASLSGGGTVSSIVVASETASNPFVFGSSTGDVQADTTFNVVGNIGCSVLCSFKASFNYRDVTLTLGDAAAPSGLKAPITEPFDFAGGGTEQGITIPKSRVVVSVVIEGATYSMILDTGATDVTVSQAVFTALTGDGRAQMSGGTAETTSGTSVSAITRAKSIAVGGASVHDVVVAHDPSFDQNLGSVSTDVGHTIDGSLGGTFLNQFYVTIDYATQTLTLAPYDDTTFILDVAEHLGFTLGTDGVNYFVTETSSTVAAKGVTAGDDVVAIDGTELSTLTPLEVATQGFGPVGSTKKVTFGAAAHVDHQTVALPIEETLPYP